MQKQVTQAITGSLDPQTNTPEGTTSAARQDWLEETVSELRLRFEDVGYLVPEKVRVSIGFPKRSPWKHPIGQCWPVTASSDGYTEIFISPELGTADRTIQIIGTVAHELVHATVGTDAGHRTPFKRCAVAIGLTGRMTATTESEAFKAWVEGIIIPKIGPYPAGLLTLSYRNQGTRMVKCECETCHYLARTTQKWIDEQGPPWCPTHGVMIAYPSEPKANE
jgi:hypothetical protein